MHFSADNESVSLLLLMAVTVFMIGVRVRKPLETNWLLIYWLILAGATLLRAADWFDYRFIVAGLIAGLLLRFEFMNQVFSRLIMVVEMFVFGYVLLAGWKTLLRY
jgi:hypothetical protein